VEEDEKKNLAIFAIEKKVIMVTVTISGTPGSGKSTVAQLLEKRLGARYVYTGMVFRKLAQEHHMSLKEFGSYCEQHPEVDKEIDDYQLKALKKGDVILEGRIAGWIAYRNNIPAFKIMLIADIDIRARRIVKREDGDVEQRKQEIREREKSEVFRYKTYYDIDVKDTSIYDLVIDTSDKTPEEIMDLVVHKLRE
jgi:predicted cytidylate kinase